MIEKLKRANDNLPKMKIKGKDYVMVKDRVSAFRGEFPDWSIITEIVRMTEDEVVMKATVFDPEGRAIATGHAHEDRTASGILSTSWLEVAETSAIGRSLGLMNIGIDDSFGSYDEVNNAMQQQAMNEGGDRLSVKEIENLIDAVKLAKGDSREQAIDRIESMTGKKMQRLSKEDYAKVAMEVSNG